MVAGFFEGSKLCRKPFQIFKIDSSAKYGRKIYFITWNLFHKSAIHSYIKTFPKETIMYFLLNCCLGSPKGCSAKRFWKRRYLRELFKYTRRSKGFFLFLYPQHSEYDLCTHMSRRLLESHLKLKSSDSHVSPTLTCNSSAGYKVVMKLCRYKSEGTSERKKNMYITTQIQTTFFPTFFYGSWNMIYNRIYSWKYGTLNAIVKLKHFLIKIGFRDTELVSMNIRVLLQ